MSNFIKQLLTKCKAQYPYIHDSFKNIEFLTPIITNFYASTKLIFIHIDDYKLDNVQVSNITYKFIKYDDKTEYADLITEKLQDTTTEKIVIFININYTTETNQKAETEMHVVKIFYSQIQRMIDNQVDLISKNIIIINYFKKNEYLLKDTNEHLIKF